MTIDMNWAEVSRAAAATRELTEQAVSRINRTLEQCRDTAAGSPRLLAGNALSTCSQGWAAELSGLVRDTLTAADNLDGSAKDTQQVEERNTRAANALQGIL